MNQTMYVNIDEILGDHCKRFFSFGYKHVKHRLADIKVNPSVQSASAVASIFYPADWSTKDEDTELKPHLSTLDGLIISIHLNTLFIDSLYNLNEFQKSHIWIRKVRMKSGATALLDLENIRITTKLIKTEITTDSLCGHLTTFKTQIGNMSIEMVLDHYINEFSFDAKSFKDIGAAFEKVNTSYYGSYYRECNRDLMDLQLDTENKQISAWIKINYPDQTDISNGISSIYYPFYTPIDTFVCASQQIQALFYLMDNIDRDKSNNLWMRQVDYESKQPIYRPSGFKQTVSLVRTKVLGKENGQWRVGEFECKLDAFPDLFKLNVNIAHELPKEVKLGESS
ncbi:AvrD family protein [Bacillus sp. JJ634]